MQELSTKVKKNNFFQNIRLGYYRRKAYKNLTIDDLLKLPLYIQNDGVILLNLRNKRNIPDSEWRKLDVDILLRHVELDVFNQEFFLGYSDEQLYSILKSGKVDLGFCDRNAKEEIVIRLIQKGFYDVLKLNLDKQQHEFNQNILKKLREKNIEEMFLPNIIKYLDMSSINSIIASNPKLIQSLDKQQQLDVIETQKDKLAFLTPELQKECIEKNIELFKYASANVKKELVKQDINMFKKIDYDSQMELISYDSRLYTLLPYELKQTMLEDFNEIDEKKKNPNVINAVLSMVKQDINNTKYFNVDNPSVYAFKLLDGLENLDIDTIKKYVLHSKICGAIGKLTGTNFLLHGQSGGEEKDGNGIDSYNQEQIDFINKLTTKQIKELIKIDSNYILPYLSDSQWKIVDKFVLKDYDESKNRCTNLFLELYGKEKLEEYSKSIDLIYEMQKKYDLIAKERYHSGVNPVSNYEIFNKQGEIPLEEFKILFNEKIINSCNPKEIEEYLTEIAEGGKGASEKFVHIIEKAYGEEAKEILKSRPELNVHSINSLEVFDSRILGRYGEAFVHDCISYNLRDFSEFLDAIKDEKQSDNFYEYYETLCNIYGRNVETMQKAMSEYSYVKDIIEDVKDKDLTEKQTMNLLNVFCTKRNEFNIRNIEELDNFDQIANSKMLREIEEIDISKDDAVDTVKQIICSNLLGMEYEDNKSLNYGKSLQSLTTLYDFGTDEISKTQYSEEEKKFMEILYFISKEIDIRKLAEFAKNTTELPNLRNLVTINRVIDKVIEKETHELNGKLTSIEKIKAVCKEQEGKENPQAYYEEVDGLQVFHLTGMDYCMFSHDLGTLTCEDWLRYEGQGGNSAICSRVVKGNMGNTNGKFLFGELPKEGLITISGRDANTQHVSKRVRSYADQQQSIKKLTEIELKANETSFYRRQRSHENISNENAGGRIKPMAYGTDDISTISEEQKKFLIANGIPIIIVHKDKYNTKGTEFKVEKEESGRI